MGRVRLGVVRSVNPKEHSVFTTRLALGFAVVLAAAAPSLPASASADYPSPATIARTAHGIDYAAYVVRRGAYGRTVVRRGPYRTVVRHRAPYYGRVVVRRPYYGYRAPYYGRTVVRRGPYRTVVRRRGW
jgi:hypothetical protein